MNEVKGGVQMEEINFSSDELQLLIDNTRYSIAKDARKLINLEEETQPTSYRITKERSKRNSELLIKLFKIKNS